jgi:hypothetical protein
VGGKIGGAIYQSGGALTLTGNLFYGNLALADAVVYSSVTVTSNGFNVSDKLDNAGGTGDRSGWIFNEEYPDVTLTNISFDGDFRPVSASGGLPAIAPPPEGFPALYFDGTPREASGASSAPGAMPAQ